MTYYYQFELDGNIIGYTKQRYSAKLLPTLDDKHVRRTVKDNFCNKYNLDHDKVVMTLEASRGVGINELEFDFKYNGR